MTRFTALDALVIVGYLVGITALGIYVGRRQRDAKDYFIADRTIPWWAVMFSIVASETSALTFISIPGLAYVGNLGFLEIATGYLVGRIVLAYTLLPRYYEGNLVTAYALLEQRVGIAARRFTSVVFMVTRGMAASVRVYSRAPAGRQPSRSHTRCSPALSAAPSCRWHPTARISSSSNDCFRRARSRRLRPR